MDNMIGSDIDEAYEDMINDEMAGSPYGEYEDELDAVRADIFNDDYEPEGF